MLSTSMVFLLITMMTTNASCKNCCQVCMKNVLAQTTYNETQINTRAIA